MRVCQAPGSIHSHVATPTSCGLPSAGPSRSSGTRRPLLAACSYTWPQAGSYTVTATVYWSVTWTAVGAAGGGNLGLQAGPAAEVPVTVTESQAINTPTGGATEEGEAMTTTATTTRRNGQRASEGARPGGTRTSGRHRQLPLVVVGVLLGGRLRLGLHRRLAAPGEPGGGAGGRPAPRRRPGPHHRRSAGGTGLDR